MPPARAGCPPSHAPPADGRSPPSAGLAIGNSDTIRSVHNSFSPPQPLIPEEASDEKGEAFHFIAYVPVGWVGGSRQLRGAGSAVPASTLTCTLVRHAAGWQAI